ncbi:MAG: GNAT family N-acetyltransferase [Bacteroidota bacterium]
MTLRRLYIPLHSDSFVLGNFQLVPIRFEDRYQIMKWRNEQIFHLRQERSLTEQDQDHYFNEVVEKLFDQEEPHQLLFSFLESGACIGYGGLVHINWKDQNAEVSFIMDTDLEAERFGELWGAYLSLIKQVAFEDLALRKIFTFAYDLRPHLYPVLINAGFEEDARLRDHVQFDGKYSDVLIHSCLR